MLEKLIYINPNANMETILAKKLKTTNKQLISVKGKYKLGLLPLRDPSALLPFAFAIAHAN